MITKIQKVEDNKLWFCAATRN